MTQVPSAKPVTTPLESTLATSVLPELQYPPVALLVSVISEPTQTEVAPEIEPASGVAFTVITAIEESEPQALSSEKFKIAIPAVNAITVPFESTDATDGLLLLQIVPDGS